MTMELILIGIAWFIAAFTLLQVVITTLNLIFRADYSSYKSAQQPLVSVVIPVRNEEATIGLLLDDLAQQSYPNLEIIIANDDSTDDTALVVKEKQKHNTSIRMTDAGLSKTDWLGKNHACFCGSRSAKGRYLLFLDADVRLGKDAIASTLAYLQQKNLVFMSVFPRQLIQNQGVNKVVPLMNYILLSLLPLFLVNKASFSSLAAANGQFMLFDHELYTALEPHKHFKKEKVEDIHIARYIKRNGYRIACLTGNEDISCSMYENYEDAMEGFSKNVFAFFGESVTAGLMFWFITFSGLLWMLLLPWYMLPLYLIVIGIVRWQISIVSKQDPKNNLRMHYNQLWTLGRLMLRALDHKLNKSHQWKGRSIT